MAIRHTLFASITAAVLAGFSPAARADFQLVSSDLSLNKAAGVVDFNLTFNQPPQFGKIAADGNPANSFQIEINSNPVLGPNSASESNLTAVIRGDEIHVGNDLRVRSATGNGGAGSGGWGPVVAAVPYTLTSNKMTFAIPAKDLGVTGTAYSASIFSLSDGALTAEQSVNLIPTPTGAVSGMIGLAAVAALVTLKKYLPRRA